MDFVAKLRNQDLTEWLLNNEVVKFHQIQVEYENGGEYIDMVIFV